MSAQKDEISFLHLVEVYRRSPFSSGDWGEGGVSKLQRKEGLGAKGDISVTRDRVDFYRARPSCSLPLSLQYHSLCARLPRLWPRH